MMPVYLGSLGRLVKLPYVTSQSVEAEERYSFDRTLEGRRKAQAKPIGRRTWALATQHFRPNEHSLLSQFANGAWGAGPFVFVPADALVSNMLTPALASIEPSDTPFAQGGPVLLPDGSWAPRSLLGDGVANVTFGSTRSPVLTGVPVSAGVWVQGSDAACRLNWYDEADAFVGSATSTIKSSGGFVWSTLTATPPAGAVSVRVSADLASKCTHPVMVWGSVRPASWSEGQGCAKAVVSSFSRDQVLAVQGHTYSNVSFTVSEVG